MTRIFFLSQLSPILELFPFDKITLKSHIFVLLLLSWASSVGVKSGSWGHSVLQTPALVLLAKHLLYFVICYAIMVPHIYMIFFLYATFPYIRLYALKNGVVQSANN